MIVVEDGDGVVGDGVELDSLPSVQTFSFALLLQLLCLACLQLSFLPLLSLLLLLTAWLAGLLSCSQAEAWLII